VSPCLPPTGDWIRHGAAQAIADYDTLMTTDELATLREDARFTELLDRFKIVPSRLAREFDFSSSSTGRFIDATRPRPK
jgi:hypothetical protein